MASDTAPVDHADDELDDGLDDRESGEIRWGSATGVALTVWSALGLVAAFALSVDKVRILEDPTFQPSCNINPVLSCGSVMVTDQASAFGFPNPFLGVAGFSMMLVVGVMVLLRVRLPGLVLAGAAAGSVAGLAMVHWLIFQSLYEIGALCPWCMVVWAVTMPLATWFLLAAASRIPSRGLRRGVRAVWQWRFTVVFLWYVGVVVLALVRFWDYWSTLV